MTLQDGTVPSLKGTEELSWVKAARCESSWCVEAAATDEGVLLRNSQDPTGPGFHFDAAHWKQFTEDVRAGIFDFDTAPAPEIGALAPETLQMITQIVDGPCCTEDACMFCDDEA